ncbi:Putative SWI/SNF-related matrix-associated actin-dependent regulator [Tolypocladium paradoxum]|uniref:SWI/SNF-related matrix-associated actin-dependent regulator n=1 Tax=Tolypocladium paradoxum TaxID=94208 RepID=A0A2S4KWQ7_9HYPO|nr:Putative SWI/SNF-related matrix-associated actin-dependent regulator [Tolypocladium paradoxum]
MATNGTYPLPPSPSHAAASTEAAMFPGFSEALAGTPGPAVFSSEHRPDSNAVQGRSSHPPGATPSWNAAALLQPSRRANSAVDLRSSGSNQSLAGQYQALRDRSNTAAPESMVFQFASANEASSSGPPSDASTPSNGDVPSANGVGTWIERMNNVQSRSSVPQAKRRKTEDGQDFAARTSNIPVRSGSGVLGEYVKERRNEANGQGLPQTQTLTVDLTDGNDDDDMVVSDPKDEEVCYGMVKSGINCNKVPSPKPGTLSLWGPGYQPAIKIMLKRHVGERSLKIHATDHTREIIGVVESNSAAAFCPLLDTNIRMRTECRIPPHPKTVGEEPGQPTSRTYALDVVMYGPRKYAKNVGLLLQRHRLKLIAPSIVQKGIKVFNPHNTEYRPPPPKMYPTDSQGSYASPANRTVEEIRSEVMGVFDSLKRNDDLPPMDPDSCVTTPLLKHQRQGLYFMATREKPLQDQSSDKAMVSFWQTKVNANGQKTYSNAITGQEQRDPPPETRGGILADMMGLGKTLSILSLIASSTDDAHRWELLAPVQRPVLETKPSRNDGLMMQQPSFDPAPVTRQAKSTLIVCPLSTITNWEEQMKQHLRPGSLSCHIYHGSNRIKDPAKLATFDIVITTYGSVSNELSSRRKRKDGLYPLEEIGWFRIVLDEAHMIREQSTLQFKAMCRLQAERRWAVTGTPVQNRLDDLAALLGFLRLYPFDNRPKFNRFIVEPFKACDPEIVPKLRVLVDTITLRRLKDKIDLPPREDFVVRLDFSPEERAVYDLFARNAQDRVKVLAGSNTSRALGGNTYIHILKAILRLRLLCAHGKDLLNDEDLAALRGMSAEMAIDIDDDDDNNGPALSHQKAHEMFALMQETNNDACIECSKKLNSGEGHNIDAENQDDILGYMTACFHVVCRSCIGTYQERARAMLHPGQWTGPCPVCNSVVRLEFVELRRDDVDAEHDGPAKAKAKNARKKLDKYDGPHTKTKALVDDLLKSKAASAANPSEPPFKSVVFSGWTSNLDLIELALNAAGISFARLDGSMSRPARTAAMDSFRDDNSVEVILVSIMAGGLGLNLTAGNNVYVMEPQYNPAAEAQAVDRVHRLGQKRPVRTVRYIMRGSFEEKMLELQDKKMKLASLSMDGQSRGPDKAEAARQKLMDLRSLFK